MHPQKPRDIGGALYRLWTNNLFTEKFSHSKVLVNDKCCKQFDFKSHLFMCFCFFLKYYFDKVLHYWLGHQSENPFTGFELK